MGALFGSLSTCAKISVMCIIHYSFISIIAAGDGQQVKVPFNNGCKMPPLIQLIQMCIQRGICPFEKISSPRKLQK